MLTISYAGCLGLFSDFGAVHSWNVCRGIKSR